MPAQQRDTENAVAYGWFMLVVFLFVAAIIYLAVIQVDNQILGIFNEQIADGTVSTQTSQAVNFNRQVGMYLPVLSLLGAFIWSVIRGVGGRGDSYGGATFQSFFTGWILLVLFCTVGFVMAFLGGMVLDNFYTSLDNAGLIDNPDVMTQKWADAQQSTMWTFVNGYYTLCYLCPIGGLVIFFQHIVRKTYGSRYTAGY